MDVSRPATAVRPRFARHRNEPPHDRSRADRARHPHRPPQRGHRRPRRSRQDHARRRHAPADRRLPRQPGRRRARHGLRRPRAREGHHHPGQADGRRLPRRPPQHRRHARPRRLRRRGRAHAADGRLDPAPRRCRRGAAAADPLRAPEGHGPPPAGGRGGQQDRPLGRARRRGPRRHLRAVHRPRRGRPPDRLPGRLHQRQGGHGHARPRPRRAPTCGPCSTCSSSTRRRRPTSPAIPCSSWSPT